MQTSESLFHGGISLTTLVIWLIVLFKVLLRLLATVSIDLAKCSNIKGPTQKLVEPPNLI